MRIDNKSNTTNFVNHQKAENQGEQFHNYENPLCRKCFKEPAYVTSNFYGFYAGLCLSCIQNSGVYKALTSSR